MLALVTEVTFDPVDAGVPSRHCPTRGLGAQDDLHIQPQAPILGVGGIEREATIEGGIILAYLDLPKVGDSGA
jgi:hypothetical protein